MLEPNQEPKAERREPNPPSQSTRSTESKPLEGSLPSSELSEAEIQIEQYRQWLKEDPRVQVFKAQWQESRSKLDEALKAAIDKLGPAPEPSLLKASNPYEKLIGMFGLQSGRQHALAAEIASYNSAVADALEPFKAPIEELNTSVADFTESILVPGQSFKDSLQCLAHIEKSFEPAIQVMRESLSSEQGRFAFREDDSKRAEHVKMMGHSSYYIDHERCKYGPGLEYKLKLYQAIDGIDANKLIELLQSNRSIETYDGSVTIEFPAADHKFPFRLIWAKGLPFENENKLGNALTVRSMCQGELYDLIVVLRYVQQMVYEELTR